MLGGVPSKHTLASNESISKRQAKKMQKELEKNRKKEQMLLADPHFK